MYTLQQSVNVALSVITADYNCSIVALSTLVFDSDFFRQSTRTSRLVQASTTGWKCLSVHLIRTFSPVDKFRAPGVFPVGHRGSPLFCSCDDLVLCYC